MMVLLFPLVTLISAIILICLIKKEDVTLDDKKEEDEDAEQARIDLKNKNLLKSIGARLLIVIHIIIIVFIKLIHALFINTAVFWVLVIVNIVVMFLCMKKNLIKDKRIIIALIVLYFIIMMVLPVYKIEDHVHYYNQTKLITDENGKIVTYEEIREYEEYYNCYGIKLYRKNK